MKLLLLLSLAVISLLTSCGSSVTGSHETFVMRPSYKQSHETYSNKEAVRNADTSKTRVIVNIATQRMIVSQGATILIDTPCTTGRVGKRTPLGTFKLYDRVADKYSNVYGNFYKGGKLICQGHRFEKCNGISYDKYVGTPLPHWQRLTENGIGMHGSKYVKRHPASGGCIRLQPTWAKKIFGLTREGTPISVISS